MRVNLRVNCVTAAVVCMAMSASGYLFAQDPNATPSVPGQQQQATPSTQDSSGAAMSGEMMRDKMFLRRAAEGGIAEVQLGQLAEQKAESADVKAFGEKMVTDHTALNDSMKPVADSLGFRLPQRPNKKDQAEYEKLNGLSGSDFDKAYMTLMVKEHHIDLHLFKQEAAIATDPGLREAVEKGEVVIREHMHLADKLARGMGIPTPGPRAVAPAGD